MTLYLKGDDDLNTCGIAGIGNLSEALTQQFVKNGVKVYPYHPDSKRREQFADRFSNAESVNFSDLLKQNIVLLAIPAEAIYPFMEKVKEEIKKHDLDIDTMPTFVNLSTLIKTTELQKDFSNLNIYGLKMLGHANYLFEHGNGMFLTETPLDDQGFQSVKSLFEKIATVYHDDEKIVEILNKAAVRKIIEACMKYEQQTKDYPKKYAERVMKSIFPNTMKFYMAGHFDGFMLQVIDEISAKSKNE